MKQLNIKNKTAKRAIGNKTFNGTLLEDTNVLHQGQNVYGDTGLSQSGHFSNFIDNMYLHKNDYFQLLLRHPENVTISPVRE